jgi:uncharacterized protein YjlB
MKVSTKPSEPLALMFADDGSIPNNPRLPCLVYRKAIDLAGASKPEEVIEKIFVKNGWGKIWRNGILPYAQYHSMIHETLAIARGRAKVRFGGAQGRELDLIGGDVVVLPAGTGHQGVWSAPELVAVGAFALSGHYNLCRGSKAEYAKALVSIPHVPLPTTDPVFGEHGPLCRLWKA